MERLSVFDIYKIGVGPSSSHTLGPWIAAQRFALALIGLEIDEIEVHLFGSLSKTGIGHATDYAVQLGLEGHDPKKIDTLNIPFFIERIRSQQQLVINGQPIQFNPKRDIIFENSIKPAHPNTLIFKTFFKGALVLEHTYYSVGGGFIERKGKIHDDQRKVTLPFPIDYGEDLIQYTDQEGVSISEIVHRNELHFHDEEEIETRLVELLVAMRQCIFKGCNTEGVLPGGLNVKRRAGKIARQLLGESGHESCRSFFDAIKNTGNQFRTVNHWINCFALAVNEENASMGRIVTSPTNGAAGVIPAVLCYYYCFCDYNGREDLKKFMFTSGEIGCLFKKGATISAAVGGCQAEIGVSSAMAAAGLTELMGGTPRQVLMAAEIAMEHHLGLTCDPIGGLVQIPCIERNAIGAAKAITASNLALVSNPNDALVNFDVVVKSMWDTARDMNGKYKETAEGGLAFNLPIALPEC
jgi:L-serine dehydratase